MLEGLYCGPPPMPENIWSEWNGDPWLLSLFAIALIYVIRSPIGRRPVLIGVLIILALAFLSPLCAFSSALFSARAVHHLLIIFGAAPLLAVAVRPFSRIDIGLALAVFTATLWLWHVPFLYDAALANKVIYWAMQMSLLGSAWLFWAAVMHGRAEGGFIALLGATMQMGFLGALLSFAPNALYAAHFGTTAAFGMSALADQQLAGLIMWVPGMFPFAFVAARIATRRWHRLTRANE